MKKTVNEMQARNREIITRMSDLVDISSKRELNDAEKNEEVSLKREYENNVRAITTENQQREIERNAPAPMSFGMQLREAAKEVARTGQQREVSLSVLSEGATNNIRTSGAIELSIQEMLPVLEKGLIWDKVGLKMMSGVTGDLLWPYASNSGEAEEVGETVALTDAAINFGKKQPVLARVGVEVAVTRDALEDAAFDLAGFVLTEMNRKVARLLNKKTFGTPNFSGLKGPFANTTPTAMDGTYANIKAKKALIAATGVDMSTFAYVCDNKTKALLESTPKANGQGGFILENGKIDGDPVYVTEYVNIKSDGSFYTDKYYLEMGCWGELAGCQHGTPSLIIDPYTKAGKNEIRFVLNTRFSITNLDTSAGAFAAYNLTPATTESVSVTVANTSSNPVPTQEITPSVEG